MNKVQLYSKLLLIGLLCYSSPTVLAAQLPSIKYYRQLGEQLMVAKDYKAACDVLVVYEKSAPKLRWTMLRLAICSYHLNRVDDLSIYLDRYEKGNGKREVTAQLYQAHLSRLEGKYDLATKQYKDFLRLKNNSLMEQKSAQQALRYCGTAIRYAHRKKVFDVQSNALINTDAEECCPISSPNYEEIMYFSSDVLDNQQIYSLDLSDSTKSLLSNRINTAADERLIGFGRSGTVLYFERNHQLWQEDFEAQTTKQISLPNYVQITDLQVFSDSILLFSSDSLAGFGGSDLFYSKRLNDEWSSAKNLGATINSPNDESHPFLAADGRTLYFSSNCPEWSMGGKDIVKSVFQLEEMTWSLPENLSLQINSYADEIDVVVHPNRTTAYFSSNRKGQFDIYVAETPSKIEFQKSSFFFADVVAFQQNQLLIAASLPSSEDYIFRVQLATYNTESDLPELSATFPFPYQEAQQRSNQYVQGFGRYRSFASALEWAKIAQQQGWEAAVVVLYQNNNLLMMSDLGDEEMKNDLLIDYFNYLKETKD